MPHVRGWPSAVLWDLWRLLHSIANGSFWPLFSSWCSDGALQGKSKPCWMKGKHSFCTNRTTHITPRPLAYLLHWWQFLKGESIGNINIKSSPVVRNTMIFGLNSSRETWLEAMLSLCYEIEIIKFITANKQTVVLIFWNTLGMTCIRGHHQQSMVTISRVIEVTIHRWHDKGCRVMSNDVTNIK